MTKTITYILLFILSSGELMYAQESTFIDGKIIGSKGGNILLRYYTNTTTLEEANITVEVNAIGEFRAEILIEDPQIVTLQYQKVPIPIYLEPHKNLGLVFEDHNRASSIRYLEKNGQNNNEVLDAFDNRFGYRNEKNVYSNLVQLPVKLYQALKFANNVDRFFLLEKRHAEEIQFFESAIEQKPNLSTNFIESMRTEIKYRHLAYLKNYVDSDDLPQVSQKQYYNLFPDSVYSDTKALRTLAYQMFLGAYSKCACEEKLDKALAYYTDYKVYYNCIKTDEQLSEASKEYVLGRLIYLNIKPEKAIPIKPLFEDFKMYSKDRILSSEIEARYRLASSLSSGTTAPNFELEQKNGEMITLSELKGKKVYISFWASWCGPCKAEILASKDNRAKLKNEDIKFVYININDEKETWQNHSITKKVGGIHLWTGSQKNEVLKTFGIVTIPKRFLLNESGQFISPFPASDSDGFVNFVKEN